MPGKQNICTECISECIQREVHFCFAAHDKSHSTLGWVLLPFFINISSKSNKLVKQTSTRQPAAQSSWHDVLNQILEKTTLLKPNTCLWVSSQHSWTPTQVLAGQGTLWDNRMLQQRAPTAQTAHCRLPIASSLKALNQVEEELGTLSGTLDCPFLCSTLPLVPLISSKKAALLLSLREKGLFIYRGGGNKVQSITTSQTVNPPMLLWAWSCFSKMTLLLDSELLA